MIGTFSGNKRLIRTFVFFNSRFRSAVAKQTGPPHDPKLLGFKWNTYITCNLWIEWQTAAVLGPNKDRNGELHSRAVRQEGNWNAEFSSEQTTVFSGV